MQIESKIQFSNSLGGEPSDAVLNLDGINSSFMYEAIA